MFKISVTTPTRETPVAWVPTANLMNREEAVEVYF